MNLQQLPKTIEEVHQSYESGALKPSELIQFHLIVSRQNAHNAVLQNCDETAVMKARALNAVLAANGNKIPKDQPLFGIPVGVKDNIAVAGLRTSCASKMLENYVAPYTATVVERLESAGAIVVNRLNMDEFAMGGSNENSAFGAVKHPTHPDRVPGGSSGGSACAVRAGLCTVALGSDTGGSIRLPAAYCGLVGFKPTYGRVSRYGLVAFASSLDQIGPFGNSVDDAARVFSVMGGHDARDSTSHPSAAVAVFDEQKKPLDIKALRIGVPKEYWSGGLEPEVEASLKKALAWFESQGATLREVSLPHTQYSVAVYYVVAVSEASSNLARFDGVRFGVRPPKAAQAGSLLAFYKAVRSNFGPEVKRRILLGTFTLSSGYYDAYYKRACQVRRLIKNDFDHAFREVDVIIGPVSTGVAYKLGEKSNDPLKMYLNDIFTIPANLAGIPALSVPCGETAEKLPIGIQFMGPAFADAKVLQVGRAFEAHMKGGV